MSARTSRTPASFSTRAQASSVAPVVLTSSTSTAVASASDRARGAIAKAPRTFRWRCAAGRLVCVGVARTRRSAWWTGTPSWRARSSA